MKLKLLGYDPKANATYEVIFSEPTTVKDFICDVLENGGDWGYIAIGEGRNIFEHPHCEYSLGRLMTYLSPKYFFKKIKSAEAYGGMGRMDYMLTLEED